jgi:O-6-methylguanine DNA methyltransferase
MILRSSLLQTPLGFMLALADEKALYLLEFLDAPGLQGKVAKLTQGKTLTESNSPLLLLEEQLSHYFNGTLREFTVALHYTGTPFQQSVWGALRTIPFGSTCSYKDIASALGRPTAVRAVARANSQNFFPLLIPCHRVINANGKLGGYSSGTWRKQWLIDHEVNTNPQ